MNARHKKPEKSGIWGRHPWAVACPDGRGRFVSWPFRRFVKAIAAVGGPSPARVLRRRRRGLGNQQTKKPNNQITNEPKNQRTKEPKNQRTKEPKNQRTKEPKNQRTKEPKNQRTKEPKNQRTNQLPLFHFPAAVGLATGRSVDRFRFAADHRFQRVLPARATLRFIGLGGGDFVLVAGVRIAPGRRYAGAHVFKRITGIFPVSCVHFAPYGPADRGPDQPADHDRGRAVAVAAVSPVAVTAVTGGRAHQTAQRGADQEAALFSRPGCRAPWQQQCRRDDQGCKSWEFHWSISALNMSKT